MRKVVVSMNMTLDGFMAGPGGTLDWHYSYWDHERARAAACELGHADTLLFGRITYQAMAGYWQAMANNVFGAREDADFAQMMNSYRKIVFSKTLYSPGNWNNSRLGSRDIRREIRDLKNDQGKDILVYGSGKLVDALVKYNLIDEYRLWVHPVAIKTGRPVFKLRKDLQLIDTQKFDNGVVLMRYGIAQAHLNIV